EAPALPGLRPGAVDLEHLQACPDIRAALREGVEACSEDHVLADAVPGLREHEVFDETRPRDDTAAEAGRPTDIHVRALTPALAGRREREADLILQYVRWRIDLHVHRAPQCDAYRRAIWTRGLRIGHRSVFSRRYQRSGLRNTNMVRSVRPRTEGLNTSWV